MAVRIKAVLCLITALMLCVPIGSAFAAADELPFGASVVKDVTLDTLTPTGATLVDGTKSWSLVGDQIGTSSLATAGDGSSILAEVHFVFTGVGFTLNTKSGGHVGQGFKVYDNGSLVKTVSTDSMVSKVTVVLSSDVEVHDVQVKFCDFTTEGTTLGSITMYSLPEAPVVSITSGQSLRVESDYLLTGSIENGDKVGYKINGGIYRALSLTGDSFSGSVAFDLLEPGQNKIDVICENTIAGLSTTKSLYLYVGIEPDPNESDPDGDGGGGYIPKGLFSVDSKALLSQASSMVNSFAPIMVLVIGVFLGFRVVRFVISLFG